MRESDIRPTDLFNRYLQLVCRDNQRMLRDKSKFVDVACPACDSWKQDSAFKKSGFQYVSCQICDSLYLSPRPDLVSLSEYCRDADAVRFLSDHFYKETVKSRKKNIFKPRAARVYELAELYNLAADSILADVGSGFGVFLEEVSMLNRFRGLIAVEPAPELAVRCRSKGFTVLEKAAEQLTPDDAQVSMLTAFEVLEHVFDPAKFLGGCALILSPGGLLQFSTLTVSGFEINVLRNHSKNVYAPHHINLLSVKGIQCLIERCGLELIELSTPGQLDVDIVSNTVQEDPGIPLSRFVEHLLTDCDDNIQNSFQEFLVAHRLSSHLQCVVRRPFQNGGDGVTHLSAASYSAQSGRVRFSSDGK